MDRAKVAKRAALRLAIISAVGFAAATGADVFAQLHSGNWGIAALILGGAVLTGALGGCLLGYWIALKRLNRS